MSTLPLGIRVLLLIGWAALYIVIAYLADVTRGSLYLVALLFMTFAGGIAVGSTRPR